MSLQSDKTQQEEVPPPSKRRWQRLMMRAPALFGLVLLIVAVFVIWRELRCLSVHDIFLSLHGIPASALWEGAGATVIAYAILSFYDGLACRHVKAGVSWGRSAFVAFCAYVLSHNIGCAAVSGTAVRYRLYRSWGVSGGKVASIVAFCSITYLLGTLGLVGFVLLWQPRAIPLLVHLPLWVPYLVGGACYVALLGYVGVSVWRKELRLFRWTIDLPGWRLALGQIIISMADMSVTALIAWCVIGPLPASCGLTFGGFLAIYIVSYTAGLVASVPGGLGVFESTMLLSLSPWLPVSRIMSAILVFRLFYYIIPLLVAGFLFAGHELLLRGLPLSAREGNRGQVLKPNEVVRESEADFSVIVATGLQALLGVSMVIYALIAPLPEFHSLIHATLTQLAVFGLCVCGVMLVGLSLGLSQRVALAWRLSVGVLCATFVALLFRQAHWITWLIVAAVLMVLVPFRGGYYRQAHWRVEPLSPAILAPLSLWLFGLAGMGWVAVQRHLGPIWWRAMIYDAHTAAGRWFLGVSALCCIYALWRAVKRTQIHPFPWTTQSAAAYGCLIDDVAPRNVLSCARIIPDGFIRDETNRAGIAFVRMEPYLLALDGAVGGEAYYDAAIWRMRDYALQEGYGLAFLQQGDALASIYEDLGLSAFPLAEGWYLFCAIEHYSSLMVQLKQKGFT